MIKVRKSGIVPPSLLVAGCSRHDGQDVQDALVLDSDKKCYLCEQFTNKTFQIEHNKGQTAYPLLKYEWTNLHMSCPYCNGRKNGGYNVLDPAGHDIEDLIEQRLNLAKKEIQYVDNDGSVESGSTIELLTKLFNGKAGLRDVKCNLLYEDLQREYVTFLGFLSDYKMDNSNDNKQKIIDSLLITKEFLAFKYWLIKDDAVLDAEFATYVVWNK